MKVNRVPCAQTKQSNCFISLIYWADVILQTFDKLPCFGTLQGFN